MLVFPFPFLGSCPEKKRCISLPPQKRNPSTIIPDILRGSGLNGQWQDQWDPAGITDGLDIGIGDELAVVDKTTDNDSDFGFV